MIKEVDVLLCVIPFLKETKKLNIHQMPIKTRKSVAVMGKNRERDL